MKNTKPVIFLAFANEQANVGNASIGGGELMGLENEQKGIAASLEKAINNDLCELVIEPSLTIDELVDIFQDEKYKYKDPYSGQIKSRISIFHFAGHAGSYQLLLESENDSNEVANSQGLVPFLAGQESLQLVFLNGCSTQKQSEDLIDAGVPIVIGTSQKINDSLAYQLAINFYQNLGKGYSIEHTWAEAVAKTSGFKQAQEVAGTVQHRGFVLSDETVKDAFPWKLYLRKGAEEAAGWNLPDAARKPLFSLPPLLTKDFPKDPFPFLQAYDESMSPVYFGRGQQIRRIFELAETPSTPPLLLFYGDSGTGKTSLLKAGLMPRLGQKHQVEYFSRSTTSDLILAICSQLNASDPGKILQAWEKREKESGNPLTLILDQLGEMDTLVPDGQQNEAELLFQLLNNLTEQANTNIKGKVILSYRKSFHALIVDTLETREIAHTPVYLDRLDRAAIFDIITGLNRSELADHYPLNIQEGLPEQIADDLLSDQEGVISPSLQILLTKMWQQAEGGNGRQRQFTSSLYQSLKKEFFLDDFFDKQMETLAEKHPDWVNSGLALDVLYFHTTSKGTAAEQSSAALADRYHHQADFELLIKQLTDLYLLTKTEKGTRLGHNTLGKVVQYEYNQSLYPGQQASRILELRLRDFDPKVTSTFLAEPELAIVDEGLSGMGKANEETQQLIEESRELYIQSNGILRYVPAFGYWLTAFSLIMLGWYFYLYIQRLGTSEGLSFLDSIQNDFYMAGLLFILCFPLGIALVMMPVVVGKKVRRLMGGA